MVDLLWTGGWDSTFRLLQLAQEGAEIQPHYIRVPYRHSQKKEIQAMAEIRQKVNERFPDSIIRETKIIDQSEITLNPDLEHAYQKLLERAWIGSQYIHIASYCHQKNIKCMELSIERLNQSRYSVMPCLENTEINKEGYRKISKSADKDILSLFDQFSFPILNLTKMDMLKISKKQKFFDILNISWFCHQPLLGKPCGLCNPCMSTLEEGFKYRFDTRALARYRIKKLSISHPKVHSFLGKLKRGVSSYL